MATAKKKRTDHTVDLFTNNGLGLYQRVAVRDQDAEKGAIIALLPDAVRLGRRSKLGTNHHPVGVGEPAAQEDRQEYKSIFIDGERHRRGSVGDSEVSMPASGKINAPTQESCH